MYNIEDIFLQATQDNNAVKVTKPFGRGIINYGVKIQKFPSKTEILNCARSGDYFQELTRDEYELFYMYGWREGALRLAMKNYKRKLDIIESKIKTEVNTRKNDKHIQRLKNSRDLLLIKYSKQQQKLNKIKSNGKKEQHL